jgi:hypothetical protein
MENTLAQLAKLIRMRNEVETEIARIIQRPASIGHLGEYIASAVFKIELVKSASNKGYDGWFRSGALSGKTVNVKWYARREGIIDINADALPDYYLVLAGPRINVTDRQMRTRSWVIRSVHLFEATKLVQELARKGIGIGIAASVRASLWEEAEVYPRAMRDDVVLTEDQRTALHRFPGTDEAG